MVDLQSQIDRIVRSAVPDAHGPGAIVGVLESGSLSTAVRGLANLEHHVPLKAGSVMHIASVSKQFTAYSVALLAADGLLELDDAVADHLSWFPFPGVSLRHLIHHTGGLRDHNDLMVMSGRFWEDVLTQKDIVRMVAAQREVNFPAGSEYRYCNTGYTVLAEVVQAVSGTSLREFTAERIFEPLEMRSTAIHDDMHVVRAERAESYSKGADGGWRHEFLSHSVSGSTSVNSTVSDLATWARHAMSDAVRAILEQRTVSTDGSPIDYAMGLEIGSRHGRLVLHHSGADAAHRAQLTMVPDSQVAVIVLANTDEVNVVALADELMDVALPGPSSAPTEVTTAAVAQWTPRAEDLARLAGRYVEVDADRAHELAMTDDGRLAIRFGSVSPDDDLHPLTPGAPGHLVHHDYSFDFDISDPAALSFVIGQARRARLRRVETADKTSGGTATRAGTFYSDELDVLVHVEIADDRLWLRSATWGRQPLTPVLDPIYEVRQPDTIRPYSMSLRFSPGDDELTFTTHRARRVRFRRTA